MNRVAIAAAGLAAVIVVGGLALRRSAEDVIFSGTGGRRGLLNGWMQQAPEGVARWLESFTDRGLRAFAVEAAMRVWAETDSGAAHQWLARQPASEFRDEATFAYAAAIAPADGVTAFDLVRTIQDPVRRQQLIAQIVSLDTPADSTFH